MDKLTKPPSDDYPEGVEWEVARLCRDGGRDCGKANNKNSIPLTKVLRKKLTKVSRVFMK